MEIMIYLKLDRALIQLFKRKSYQIQLTPLKMTAQVNYLGYLKL